MRTRLRIIVSGLVGLYPVGGVAWDYLQYIIGFSRLGHDVYYHEDTWSWPYHPLERSQTADATYSASYIQDYFAAYAPDLSGNWHYRHLHEQSFGMSQSAFDEVARTADVFVNVSGACLLPDALSTRCVKVFLDTDPGYNQIVLSERFGWSENVDRWCASVAAHDQHLTYAENIHAPDCAVPTLGFQWKPTRMPVVLDLWTAISKTRPRLGTPWTTVMTWDAFKGRVIYKGTEYHAKGSEFERLMGLPRRLGVPVKVAVGGLNAPLGDLAKAGWGVVDGPSVSVTPQSYQEFIAESRGELSAAKHVYVALRTGWFSCRSACYLAAGRPVVVQDTGFSDALRAGHGLLPFSTSEEAAAAVAEVEGHYERHALAAQGIAQECFDSDRVLRRFLEDIATGPRSPGDLVRADQTLRRSSSRPS